MRPATIPGGALRCASVLLLLALLVLPAHALDPATYDFSMQAGEDFALQLTLKDSSGAAVNLAGSSFRSQFRSAPYPSGQIFATYSAVIVSASTGRVDVRLSRAQTATNSGRTGVWDLQQTSATGQVSYILRGKAMVSPTVTR